MSVIKPRLVYTAVLVMLMDVRVRRLYCGDDANEAGDQERGDVRVLFKGQ